MSIEQIGLVNKLRFLTGCGRFETKVALEECNWNIEKAYNLLKQKYLA